MCETSGYSTELEGIIRVTIKKRRIKKQNFENVLTWGLKVELAKKIDQESLSRWEEKQNIILGVKEKGSIKKA